ncbi:TRAP transporter small permease [Xanthobacteraceae bacterium Astr-EGSB]|uniref:TRAP transporter small permease n=1 Tax=Astrobacterium formosum TaxID=3069710 RepID=UPI0027B397EB|nr:TRAP transporter small permease [Xanthobacteraceae bacterium Astr-EGSB]
MTTEIHTKVDADELARAIDAESEAAIDLSGHTFEDWATVALFWAMTLAVFTQFFTRYVLNDSFAWTEEIATYCLVAIVFVGSAMCVRLNRHIQVDFLYRYLPAAPARVIATMVDVVRFAFFAYASILIWRYIAIVADEEMTTVRLPKYLVYGWVFAGFVLMTLRSAQVAWQNWRRGYSVLERPEAYDMAEAR